MKRAFHSSRGGVLIVVLVFILVAGALVSGWITIMSSQSGYVDEISSGVQRRIGMNNATAMARQYLLTTLLTKGSSAAVVAEIGAGWGSVAIPAVNAAPLITYQKSGGYNHFSPGGGEGYSLDVAVAMAAGDATETRVFQMRSGSPILSGTLTVLNSPATAISGSIASSGRTLLWLPDGTFSLTSSSYAVPTQPGTTLQGGGGAVAPSNFPFPPQTGSEVLGAASYAGTLNVIANTSGINSLAVMASTSSPNGMQTVNGTNISNANGVQSDGAGNITVNLADPSLGNVIVSGGMSRLTLTGQTTAAERITAGNAAAVMILVNQTTPATALTGVTFNRSNNRKLVLAIKTENGAGTTFTFNHPGSDTWRSVIILESTPVTFSLAGGTQPLYGGIESDRAVTVGSGALTLYAEPDPKLLERLCPRDGWVESYTTP